MVHPPVWGAVARIGQDGSWEVRHIKRGGEAEVGAVLLPKTTLPPAQANDLEGIESKKALAIVPYREKFTDRGDRKENPGASQAQRIRFANRNWTVKTGRSGPGPNLFSRSAVSLDDEGNLVLKISKEDNTWRCAEVILDEEESLGYGEYRFRVSGKLRDLDPNIVLGLFVYEGPDRLNREIDGLELSRWGKTANDVKNAQFVVQPAGPDTVFRFSTGDAEEITSSFVWEPGRVSFRCWRGLQADPTRQEPTAQWVCSGTHVLKTSKEKVHMNLWLAGARPPADENEAEVVVRGFEFIPLAGTGKDAKVVDKPAIRVWVEQGNTVRGFVTGVKPDETDKYGVRVYAFTDTWYIQPYEGNIHRITSKLTFETWTRMWTELRADLIQRDSDKVVATATYKRGDPKPTQPGLKEQ